MDAVTTHQAGQILDLLIERVIANAEPTIPVSYTHLTLPTN